MYWFFQEYLNKGLCKLIMIVVWDSYMALFVSIFMHWVRAPTLWNDWAIKERKVTTNVW